MKTLVLYYSYTGHTKQLAEDLALAENFDMARIEDRQRPGLLKALFVGCPKGMSGKGWDIRPLTAKPADYDRCIVFSPVWGGNPPPAVYTILHQMPGGKAVSVKMVSSSGASKCKARIEEVLKARDCTLESFEDIRG